jgi:hypothetical protein
MLVFGAFSYAQGQTTSATPDPFVAQLTSSPALFASFAGDISANGRFVVFESNGNLDTQNPRNADGNREIFVIDYAQRRIFQITNTKNVQKPSATPTPTPTPTPSPTATPTPIPGATPAPTPVPTPPDLSLVKIEISNNRPMISFEPALNGVNRTYTIVFTSNAPDPRSFDGADSPALVANGNQEIWVYRLPEIQDDFDLSTGNEITVAPAYIDLTVGTFIQITETTPSRPIRTGVSPPDVVDDNRDATISDDGETLAFVSNSNQMGGGNPDRNPELFLARSTDGYVSGAIVQATITEDLTIGVKVFNRFQQNPSLSANGSVVAFLSTADLVPGSNNDVDGHGDEEVFAVDFSGTDVDNFRQLTKTKAETGPLGGATLNVFSAGRRLSRDGKFVAYQSRAEDPVANNGTNSSFLATFVADVPADDMANGTPKRVGPRDFDVFTYPTFTDYDPSLAPHALVFASGQNFKADGTAATSETEGLNQVPAGFLRPTQIFSTQGIPITSSNTFRRLTKNPVLGFVVGIRPIASNTVKRITFSLQAVELGGGNSPNDGSSEIFYLLTPAVTTDSPAALSFFTFPSNRGPFASAAPAASPTPTPTPSPGDPAGLAPGEWSVTRSTAPLANSDQTAGGGPENERSPILPVELNGVSVSVNGAAAGLYFVGGTPAGGIQFVVPVGVSTGVASVVINNRGTVFRGFVQIVPSQPDLVTSTHDAGGLAYACNITNTATAGMGCIMGPFKVTSPDKDGNLGPTVLELHLTGARFALASETKVSFINGTTTTDITPTSVRPNLNMFGEDQIIIVLPATLAGMAPIDYKIVVTVTKGGSAFTSRPEATAPQITIIP